MIPALTDFKDKKIVNVIIKNEDEILIFFDNCENLLRLTAVADRSSESWFETYGREFNSLIGNNIVDIVEDSDIDMEPSDRYECDKNILYKIKLGNGEDFALVLRNSSIPHYWEGYILGWLNVDYYIDNTKLSCN